MLLFFKNKCIFLCDTALKSHPILVKLKSHSISVSSSVRENFLEEQLLHPSQRRARLFKLRKFRHVLGSLACFLNFYLKKKLIRLILLLLQKMWEIQISIKGKKFIHISSPSKKPCHHLCLFSQDIIYMHRCTDLLCLIKMGSHPTKSTKSFMTYMKKT